MYSIFVGVAASFMSMRLIEMKYTRFDIRVCSMFGN